MPPAGEGDDALDVFDNRALAYDVLTMYFERSLAEVAEALQAAGFDPPRLSLYRDNSGIVYYKVNVFDFSQINYPPKVLGVYHRGIPCYDPGISTSTWFGVTAKNLTPLTPSNEPLLYIALAHELVHAIQSNYPASHDALGGCNANTLDFQNASEGTANALAFHLAARKWPKYYLKYQWQTITTDSSGNEFEVWKINADTGALNENLVGLRNYSRPFLDLSEASASERSLAAYNTASFWFNVTDRYGIGFVDYLLRQPLAHGDFPSLLEWVDDALRSYRPDIDGLYTVFPHFVTEFASQAGSRFPFEEFGNYSLGRELDHDPDGAGELKSPIPSGDDEWRRAWIERVLGKCQEVVLRPDESDMGEVRFSLDRLGAACLDISWQGFNDNFELYLEAEHSSLRMIDQVNIGLIYQRWNGKELYCYNEVHPHYSEPLWTCMHEKPFLTSGSQPLIYTKRWSETGILFNGDGHRLVAISNVARNARDTRAFTDRDPLVVRVGIAESKARDGKHYDPPFSAFKGSPGMGMARFDSESKYGITKAPTPAAMLLNFGLPVKGSEEQYGLSWLGKLPALGYRGPFKGTITAPQKRGVLSVVSSMICKRHQNGEIGRMLRFDRDHLWIDIDADLCELKVPPPANGDFPVVDHVRASLRLPFGWQYDPASAPADIVTPGMQVFIDRYNKRLPMVLSGAWQNSAGASDPEPDGANRPAAPDGSQVGAGGLSSGSVLHGDPCTCSCEELAAFDEQAEAAKKSGDNDAGMSLATEMMACMGQCQREYMLCRAGLADE